MKRVNGGMQAVLSAAVTAESTEHTITDSKAAGRSPQSNGAGHYFGTQYHAAIHTAKRSAEAIHSAANTQYTHCTHWHTAQRKNGPKSTQKQQENVQRTRRLK